MSKHTPFPWKVSLPDETEVIGPDNQTVANCTIFMSKYDEEYEECAANAALIASLGEIIAERDRLGPPLYQCSDCVDPAMLKPRKEGT